MFFIGLAGRPEGKRRTLMEIIGYWVAIIALSWLVVLLSRDGVTGLWTRGVYDIVYHYVIKTKSPCVVLFDINKFKLINDTLGHPAGDKALKQVAVVIRKESRLSFRHGGDEFAILCPRKGEEAAVTLAEGIIKTVSDLFQIDLTVGIGRNEEKADKALYLAKTNGGKGIEVFRPG